MRKVYVNLKVRLIADLDDGVDVQEVISELDYNFASAQGSGATILDTEILEAEVVDSK